MRGMEITLPGGLPRNGVLDRQARFHPLTGWIEQGLIEFRGEFDRPRYVTAVLASALDSIGSQPVDSQRVEDLCVADRQYLMLRLATLLEGEQMWLQVDFRHCHALFDVDVQRGDLGHRVEEFLTFPESRGHDHIQVITGWGVIRLL